MSHILNFDMPLANRLPDPSVWGLAYVDGVSIRVSWKYLEIGNGIFDFSLLDQAFALAHANNKYVMLRVDIEGNNMPAWLVPDQIFTPADGSAAIWPYWDSVALPAAEAMYQRLAKRYGSRPICYSISASCDTQDTGDWSCPHTAADIAQWVASPFNYTTDRNIKACTDLIYAIATAFPNQFIYLSGGRNGSLDAAPCTVSEAACNFGYNFFPNQFACGRDLWSAFQAGPDPSANGTSWETPYYEYSLGRTRFAAQSLWFTYGDTTYRNNNGVPGDYATIFTNMWTIAHQWGFQWVEIWEADILNLGAVIQANNP